MSNSAPPLPRRGVCLVIAAPSGGGKSSVARAIVQAEPDCAISVSVTTRTPRGDELDGVHYHFITHAAFSDLVAQDALLEHAEVHDNRYGTPRAPVEAALSAGRDVVFDIDWQGHLQLRGRLPGDVIGIFLLPPSMSELERRLRGRGTEDEERVRRRMANARQEIGRWGDFDHVLVNRDFAETVSTVRAILHAGRSARARQPWLPGFVAGLLAE